MKVSVVVTASGCFELDLNEELTAEQLVERAAERWGIDLQQVSQPFVVRACTDGGQNTLLDGDNPLGIKTDSILRVVLPLKHKEQD